MTNEALLTSKQVATRQKIALVAVFRWAEAKKIFRQKIERLGRFRISEVEEWIRTGGVADDSGEHRKKKAEAP